MSEYGSPTATEIDPIFQTFASKLDKEHLNSLVESFHYFPRFDSPEGTFTPTAQRAPFAQFQ
jgi:hypothetical protein